MHPTVRTLMLLAALLVGAVTLAAGHGPARAQSEQLPSRSH